jgi:hypothetical protein
MTKKKAPLADKLLIGPCESPTCSALHFYMVDKNGNGLANFPVDRELAEGIRRQITEWLDKENYN